MKIMYMGTPLFAARVLEILKLDFQESEFLVVTKPDTPKGRQYKLFPSETKVMAESLGLDVVTPENLKEENFGEILRTFAPDIIIVVAYGKILPEYVLNFPRYGAINVHGSLLPEYRGAAPVNRAIMDGKRETGVTVMYMAKTLDTGDMLSKCSVEIDDNTTATELFATLAECGGRLLCDTVRAIVSGDFERVRQDDSLSTYADKISFEDRVINWEDSAFNIVRKIHGLSEEPSAHTTMPDGKTLKIYRAELLNKSFDAPAGTVVVAKKRIVVSAGECAVVLRELQLEGAKRMSGADFLNGRKINLGDILK